MDVKAAFIHDALPFFGGAERTLQAMLAVFPGAPVFTMVHAPEAFEGTALAQADIRPSFLNRAAFVRRNHYRFFPFFPAAVRSFDLRPYDLVISSHYAIAHWARVSNRAVHLAYVYTPFRYAWQDAAYAAARLPLPLRPFFRIGQHLFRRLDRRAANRLSRIAVVSHWIGSVVRWAYGRESEVIYPPVEVDRFSLAASAPRENFVIVSRLARHKKIEVVIEAFNRTKLPLQIIGDGPERMKLARMAGPNISLLGRVADQALPEILGRARAFLHLAAEDFGIAVVEAQAAGCPVLAYRGGANQETVIEGASGLFIEGQSAEAISSALDRFLEHEAAFDSAAIREGARRFSVGRFEREFAGFVEKSLQAHHREVRRS